jgi:hypothetical protein
MNINLRIERLIFEGMDLPPESQLVFQAALKTELASLISTQELQPELAAGGTVDRLTGGTVQLTADGNPAALGRQIARAVYGGIGRGNLEQLFTRVVETG